MSDDIRAWIVAEARTALGTPFHHQARLPGVGLDCIGLIICVARRLHLVPQTFDFRGYPRMPDGVSLIHACDVHMTRISTSALRPGDAVALHFGRDPQHMGIVGDYAHGGLSLIHADNVHGVIEHGLDPSHLRRLVAAYRLPGVPA